MVSLILYDSVSGFFFFSGEIFVCKGIFFVWLCF